MVDPLLNRNLTVCCVIPPRSALCQSGFCVQRHHAESTNNQFYRVRAQSNNVLFQFPKSHFIILASNFTLSTPTTALLLAWRFSAWSGHVGMLSTPTSMGMLYCTSSCCHYNFIHRWIITLQVDQGLHIVLHLSKGTFCTFSVLNFTIRSKLKVNFHSWRCQSTKFGQKSYIDVRLLCKLTRDCTPRVFNCVVPFCIEFHNREECINTWSQLPHKKMCELN